jgi:uncharacterized membrane protein YeaQ/YmgE (transglycosylase-associated protein family)
MSLNDLLPMIPVAVICGTIARWAVGSSKGGLIINIIIGFVGALVGVVVSRSLNAPVIYDVVVNRRNFPVAYSVVGAVILLAGFGIIINPRKF